VKAPEPDRGLLGAGTYARKQLFGGVGLLSWSHGSRFRVGRALLEPHAGGRLLDYGCGDGTFLALAHDLFPECVGAEIDPRLVEECSARLGGLPGVSFVLTEALRDAPDGSFDAAVCMEVLEHCTPPRADEVLAELHRLVRPDGVVLISVPVETGLPLLVKQSVRALAAARGCGDYRHRERYSPGELARMVCARMGTTIPRPVYRADFSPDRPNEYHGHKGFNWRVLCAEVEERFFLVDTRFSPLNLGTSQLASQVWLVCRPR